MQWSRRQSADGGDCGQLMLCSASAQAAMGFASQLLCLCKRSRSYNHHVMRCARASVATLSDERTMLLQPAVVQSTAHFPPLTTQTCGPAGCAIRSARRWW